jgi:hypothetical protein
VRLRFSAVAAASAAALKSGDTRMFIRTVQHHP